MKVRLHRLSDLFSLLQSEWNELLQRSATNTPFSTFEWHKNWWEAYQPGELLVFTFRTDENLLVGIASFFVEQSEDNGRVVHFVGCEDVTDYLDILVDNDHLDSVYDALADALLEHHGLFDMLDLCNIPAISLTNTHFPEILRQKGFDTSVIRQEVCPVVPLPETFDEYLNMLDKKQRKEVRRKLRIAKGQGDELHWYIVNGTSDLDVEIDKFLELMGASHPEKAEFLQDDANQRFFRSIVPAAHEAGWLQLNFLEVAGEPVASYINFDYNNRIWVYNSGLEPNKAPGLSPGIILLSYNIEHAIEQHRESFDFLRGDEQYKYRMGGQTTEVFKLQARLDAL